MVLLVVFHYYWKVVNMDLFKCHSFKIREGVLLKDIYNRHGSFTLGKLALIANECMHSCSRGFDLWIRGKCTILKPLSLYLL